MGGSIFIWMKIQSELYSDIEITQLNAKTKIGNEALTPYLNEIINEGLDKFFEKNQSCLNEYIKIIKLNAKARVEAAKVKSAVQKEKMNSFKEHEMTNLIMCTNKGKQWKEIE